MTRPSRHGWRTLDIVEAIDFAGKLVPVKVGVIRTQGGLQIAMQVADETALVLPQGVASQLIVNCRRAIATKMQGDGL